MILQRKTVLITGGAKRIGRAISCKLAEKGCQVVVHFKDSEKEAEKLISSLPGSGHRMIRADLADAREIRRMLDETGKFELLVNNASVFFKPDSQEDINSSELYRKVNYLAPEMILEYFFDQHLDEAAAVNITDAFSLQPGSGAYWQSKHDLNLLTKQLASKWLHTNYRINAVAPGPVLPPSWAPESRMEKILGYLPIHKAVSADDIAELVSFQLSCSTMTGNIIPLDCGLLCKNL